LRQVHYFIERSLPERTFSKETDRDAIGAQALSGKGRARAMLHCRHNGNSHRDCRWLDRQYAWIRLAAAIACFFSSNSANMRSGDAPLARAMTVAPMRAGDVVVDAKRFADFLQPRLLPRYTGAPVQDEARV